MTRIYCGWDDTTLYTSEREYRLGEVVEAADLIPAEGMPEAVYGVRVECPVCEAAGRSAYVMAVSDAMEKPVAMLTDARI